MLQDEEGKDASDEQNEAVEIRNAGASIPLHPSVSEPSHASRPGGSFTFIKPESISDRGIDDGIKMEAHEIKSRMNLPQVIEEEHSNESDSKQD